MKHGLLAGATDRWIGLLPQGISLGHGGQRAQTLELALFQHIKPFNNSQHHFFVASMLPSGHSYQLCAGMVFWRCRWGGTGTCLAAGTAGTAGCWLPGLAADMGQPHWPLFEWPRDVHVSSLGQTRSAEIEAKGSLWAQQVLLQIVSFASGIVWQRETAPFESYQRTKLSQNGQMEDPMLWAFGSGPFKLPCFTTAWMLDRGYKGCCKLPGQVELGQPWKRDSFAFLTYYKHNSFICFTLFLIVCRFHISGELVLLQ